MGVRIRFVPSLDNSQKAKAQTPSLATRGPAAMQHAGMGMMGLGMRMTHGPTGGAPR